MNIENLNKKRRLWVMAGIMFGLLLASIDGTIVSTAMPKIIGSLSGFDYYAWPMTAFLLTLTISMPLFGKLADSYGFKPTYVFGIIVFLVGSALCGFSQNMIQLIFFRGLQGIGGAILSSNSLAIIGILYPPEQRAKYIGIAASAAGLGSIVGPALGGFITDHFSWRWIFYINIPIGVITFIIMMIALPNYKLNQERKRIDFPGAAALIIALVPLLLALSWGGSKYDWNSTQIVSMLLFSIVMITGFLYIETKADDPIIPLALFRNSAFNFSAIGIFLMAAVMMGGAVFIPLFVQGVVGKSASQSGAILTPLMVSMIAGALLSGAIVSKTHRYKLQAIIGFAIMGVGSLLLGGMDVRTENSTVLLNMIVMGFGTGVAMPVFNVTAQNSVSENQMGVATSGTQFFKYMGQTISASVLGTILTVSMKAGLQDMKTGSLPSTVAAMLKDPNTLSNSGALKEIMAKLPKPFLPDLLKVMEEMKQILSDSIHQVFIICIVIAAAGIISSVLMKEAGSIKGTALIKETDKIKGEYTPPE